MRLVDHDGFVVAKHWVILKFVEQDAVGHDLDNRVFSGLVRETDLRSHGVTVFYPQLFGDSLGDGEGCDAARLGAADPTLSTEPALEEEFWDLGGLAGACFAGDDDHRMRLQGADDLLTVLVNRELSAVFGLWDLFDF
jgi:hypothetical protein